MAEVRRFESLFVDGVKISKSYHKPEQSRARRVELPKTGIGRKELFLFFIE
jgi:hypothetical protein